MWGSGLMPRSCWCIWRCKERLAGRDRRAREREQAENCACRMWWRCLVLCRCSRGLLALVLARSCLVCVSLRVFLCVYCVGQRVALKHLPASSSPPPPPLSLTNTGGDEILAVAVGHQVLKRRLAWCSSDRRLPGSHAAAGSTRIPLLSHCTGLRWTSCRPCTGFVYVCVFLSERDEGECVRVCRHLFEGECLPVRNRCPHP